MGSAAVPGWTPCPGRHSGQSQEHCWDQKPDVPGTRQPEQKGAEDLSQGPRVEAVALGLLRYLPQMPEQELQGERVLERHCRRLQGQQQLLPAILWLGDLWGENKTQGKSWDSRHHSPRSGCVTGQQRCQQWESCARPHRDRAYFNIPDVSTPPSHPFPRQPGEALTLQDAKDISMH